MNANAASKIAKKTPAASTINAKTLLHFMLIRDEIGMLPRPNKRQQESGYADATVNLKHKRSKSTSVPRSKQDLDLVHKTVDLLITRLEAYEEVIKKIDRIAHHSLTMFNNVDVGGRKPDVLIKKMAEEIATDYRSREGDFPSARLLNDLVCEKLFKADPQAYIDSVKHRMKSDEVAQYRSAPAWWYWKNCYRPTSARAMHNILTELRLAE